jgi:hypothetical protein
MFLLQNVNTREVRSVLSYCMLYDAPYRRCDISGVAEYPDCVPVGSVEFVEAYMDAHGIARPMFCCYPGYVKHQEFYKRTIQAGIKKNFLPGVFVKPMATKLFTGFVYPETDEENLAEFNALPGETDCFFSEPVEFVSEYRYYVSENRILGWARYDQGDEENVPKPDASFVFTAISTLVSGTCAVDIGVLQNGESVVIEVNQAWAIGLYGENMSPSKYVKFLTKGWEEVNGGATRIRRSLSCNG